MTERNEIYITGLPHSGKSTLLNMLLEDIPRKQGFVTLEVSENGQRTGFKIVTAGGSEAILASTKIDTPIHVSRYCVDIDSLNRIIPELSDFKPEETLYIDEIGQMELYSDNFKALVKKYINSGNLFICTISKIYSDEFTQKLLSRPNIHLFEITPENRDKVYTQIKQLIKPTTF